MRRNLVILAGLGLAFTIPSSSQAQAPAAEPPAAAAPAATPAEYAAAVESLAAKLEASYVDPAIGQRYAAMLRANQATYALIADPIALAKRLTDDLRAVNPDNHLRVSQAGPEGAPGPGPRRVRMAGPGAGPRPPAIEDPKWIADGVAYIRFNMFDGAPATLAALDAFMKDHADARAIILDARAHRGGGPAEMDVMLPYLYAKPTLLVGMEMARAVVDARGGPPDEPPSMRVVPAPPGVYRREHWVTPNAETRLRDAKVFYLTSTRTGSAAEHLALALKRTGRATLIGEHTGGANHFGGFESLGAGLAAFIPVGRTFDPDTNWDWEGVGVAPDVAVPAAEALDKALELAKG